MRPVALFALSLVFFSGPALAGGARLTGLPSALLAGDAAEGTQHELAQPPVTTIHAGSTAIVLGETRLADLNQQFGGTLRHAGDAGESANWLCYSLKVDGRAAQVWFVSDGETGGPDHLVTMVASDFATPPASDCDEAGGGLANVDFSIPGLGATEAALNQAFGTVAARDGLVAYVNQRLADDGFTTVQSVNYLIKDGIIAGIAASQVTAK